MADATAAQKKLDAHVAVCEQCRTAKHIEETCPIGIVLARLVHSISTR